MGTVALQSMERNLDRWMRAGLTIVLTTGPLMFFSDTSRYLHNPAFRLKMVLAALALISHLTLRRRGRAGVIITLSLWSCVLICGRAIADFDI